MKQDWKPGTMIYPLPALLVSCGSTEEEYNIITVAWAGRSEERRVGKECLRLCRSRWSPYH